MHGDFIKHVITENKSGRFTVEVQSVIDCSEDVDIYYMADAKTALHAKGNGLASWYCFNASNKVKQKMFGPADIPKGSKMSPDKTTQSTYNAATAASLDKNIRFSGVNGEELSNAVIIVHRKM